MKRSIFILQRKIASSATDCECKFNQLEHADHHILADDLWPNATHLVHLVALLVPRVHATVLAFAITEQY